MLRSDHHKAFEILYNKYWEQLYGMAYNRLKSKEAAEEVVQDLFTGLWDRRQNLKIYKSLASYLFCALKYRILNYISAQAVRQRHMEESRRMAVSCDHNTEEKLSFDELYALMQQEIGNLPKKCRLVFQLNREGNTAKQIAKKLDISPRTAETHLSNARKILKTKLSEYNTILLLLLLM